MKMLVVTENAALRQALCDALADHDLVCFPDKNGPPAMPREAFDCVFVDPSIQSALREYIAGLRRLLPSYVYVIAVVANGADAAAAPWRGSVNGVLALPLQPEALASIMADFKRLRDTIIHLSDRSEDFPSAGGIISRSAFNQIFLSGIDRAGRYAERTSMIFFTIENFGEILQLDGIVAADTIAARLAQLLSQLRRQSDIIGQTGRGEYSLMLLRPQTESEPAEATKRFADSLGSANINQDLLTDVPVEIKLFELPSGRMPAHYRVVHKGLTNRT